MRRRKFISLIGGAAAWWPLAVRAQQPERMRRLGMLLGGTETDPQMQAGVEAFSKALAMLGWTDGRNIHVDYRWGHADVDRMRMLAKELVSLSPDLMVGTSRPPGRSLLRSLSGGKADMARIGGIGRF
jgi:putative ABC transport system substrate-binding protein